MIKSRTLNIGSSGYVVALGTFDGVHIGHRSVINAALNSGFPVAVVTSDRNPKTVLGNGGFCGKISTQTLCDSQFEALGVDAVIRLNFDEIRNLSPKQYLDMLVNELGAKGFACGFNFHFGKGASGDKHTLRDYAAEKGLFCAVCNEVALDGAAVSSTRIRRALEGGSIADVNRMLGRRYAIDFPIIHGDARGRTLGVATANQAYPDAYTVPRYAVYATVATVDGVSYRAVTNIGTRPTFCDGAAVAETHIIGEKLDLYGKSVKVEFISYLRDEVRFSSAEELVKQIEKDKTASLEAQL